MNTDQKLLGFYNYTVILTYIGMLSGFMGVVYTFEGNSLAAVICLMFAGFCDMFDGTIASTRKRTDQEKNFGIQIDSLSDLICFGVLPACLVYKLNGNSTLVLGIAAMYVLCGLIRLAYFNVDEQERQKNNSESRKIYYGMPVTLAALFVPLVYGIINACSLESYTGLAVTIFIMAFLFLLPFRLKKPKFFGKICMVLCGILEIFLVLFACIDI